MGEFEKKSHPRLCNNRADTAPKRNQTAQKTVREVVIILGHWDMVASSETPRTGKIRLKWRCG